MVSFLIKLSMQFLAMKNGIRNHVMEASAFPLDLYHLLDKTNQLSIFCNILQSVIYIYAITVVVFCV